MGPNSHSMVYSSIYLFGIICKYNDSGSVLAKYAVCLIFNNFSKLKKVYTRITDLHGRVVFELAPFNITGTGSKQIDISRLSPGVYFIIVFVGKQSFTEKLVKVN